MELERDAGPGTIVGNEKTIALFIRRTIPFRRALVIICPRNSTGAKSPITNYQRFHIKVVLH